MIKTYNKLVRDNIPSIIEANGNIPITCMLNDTQYKQELNKKLQEEMKEYLEDNNVEELADIVEVIYAILDLKGVSLEEFNKIRNEKAERNGKFKRRIFLQDVFKTLEKGDE